MLFALENNATMADAYALKADAGLAMMPVPTASAEDEPVLLGGEREAYGVWKDGPNQELALELLRFMAEKENIEKVSTASGMPASMRGATGNLGVVNESYEKYADSRVFPKFDREYLPNGMWSTMKTIGSALIGEEMTVEESVQTMQADYETLREQTAAQQALERRASKSADEAADPTARMTAALFRLAAPGSRALERMGLFVGKIIYYLDAAEDYEKDTRNGAYNVFALQGLSKAEAVAEAQRLCRMCAGEAALAYNLLEPGPCKAILDNIVFLGLPQSIALAGQKRTQPRHGA